MFQTLSGRFVAPEVRFNREVKQSHFVLIPEVEDGEKTELRPGRPYSEYFT